MIIEVKNRKEFIRKMNDATMKDEFLNECKSSSALFKRGNALTTIREDINIIVSSEKLLEAKKIERLIDLKLELLSLIDIIDSEVFHINKKETEK